MERTASDPIAMGAAWLKFLLGGGELSLLGENAGDSGLGGEGVNPPNCGDRDLKGR